MAEKLFVLSDTLFLMTFALKYHSKPPVYHILFRSSKNITRNQLNFAISSICFIDLALTIMDIGISVLFAGILP